MSTFKRWLLRSLFAWFGRCSTTMRLRCGRVLGRLSVALMRRRVHIVRCNLRLCFPQLSGTQRERLLQRHFRLLAQSVVDRGLLWFGTRERMNEALKIDGLEHLQTLLDSGQRILMLAPHFIGLDASATRLTWFLKTSATLYKPQSDPEVDRLVREGRGRFNEVKLISRREGVRGLIRALRSGVPVYYLPDMDFGHEGSAFVPFFGVPAATLLATAQIALSCRAAVVPIISRLDEATGVYHIQVLAPLKNFPGKDDAQAAVARLNALIEEWVNPDPAQYYWVHRRFKTRPPGEPSPYDH